jgi:hypoxanthine phosphoribosyltransferase
MPSIIKSETIIKDNIEILANRLNQEYQNIDTLDVICFVNGASMFCSDLIKLITVPIRLHHFGFSSYQDMPSNGQVKIEQDLKDHIEDRHVLLLEGLVISGRTPLYLFNFFKSRKPASLKLCAVGVKRKQIEVDLEVDYHMFDFEDEWIEGYGIGGISTKCLPYLIDIREGS